MKPIAPFFRSAILLLVCTALFAGPPREIRIAAAADLKWALEDVKAAFERGHPGLTCALTFGSSGNFYSQLTHAAPFDVFLSADLDYPRRLVEQGKAKKESLFTYAIGQLVLWAPKASPVPLEALGMKAVEHPAVRRIALANPRHAPYGRAAEQALSASGLLDSSRGKFILGENVSQAAQFMETGNADLGFIARSLAHSPQMRDKGRSVAVPQNLYPRLDQGGVVLTWARDPAGAEALCAFLRGAEGRAILAAHGFGLPGD